MFRLACRVTVMNTLKFKMERSKLMYSIINFMSNIPERNQSTVSWEYWVTGSGILKKVPESGRIQVIGEIIMK